MSEELKTAASERQESKTPILDELESGPWPSFITDLKRLAQRKPKVAQLLMQLNRSYETRINYWTGSVLNLKSYGGGVISRYSDLAQESDELEDIKQFHTIRVIEPSGWVYNTESLRELCDISEEYSAGIIQLHGMTGDILLLGSNNEKTHEAGEALMSKGWDIGGSGAAMRTISCCIGPARCEYSCADTLGLAKFLTDSFIGELHRPEFPYKFKFKISGCPNDCANSIQRSDMPLIGTWRDGIQVDQDEVARFIDEYGIEYLIDNVLTRCPTKCIALKDGQIEIDNASCVRCMHCINVMNKALAPGEDRGITVLLGGKRTLKIGDIMSSVLVPFMKMETQEDWDKLVALVRRIWEFWGEYALNHERVGEFIERIGLGTFIERIGLEPDPQMVKHPRTNPYIKFEELAPPRLYGETEQAPSVLDKEIEGKETL